MQIDDAPVENHGRGLLCLSGRRFAAYVYIHSILQVPIYVVYIVRFMPNIFNNKIYYDINSLLYIIYNIYVIYNSYNTLHIYIHGISSLRSSMYI